MKSFESVKFLGCNNVLHNTKIQKKVFIDMKSETYSTFHQFCVCLQKWPVMFSQKGGKIQNI